MENTPEGAMQRISEAARARSELPRFTFGWVSALLAFALFILKEYDSAWPAIRWFDALAIILLLVGAATLVVRIAALKQIETIDHGEVFEGRIPNPESAEHQQKLAAFGKYYRRATKVGNPLLVGGALSLAICLVLVVILHLVK